MMLDAQRAGRPSRREERRKDVDFKAQAPTIACHPGRVSLWKQGFSGLKKHFRPTSRHTGTPTRCACGAEVRYPVVRAANKQVLNVRRDLRLLSAPDARPGIDLALAHQPDVILMDWNPPGLIGADALRIMQAEAQAARIYVIAVTANATPHAREVARSKGFCQHWTKPIDLRALPRAIDHDMDEAHVNAQAAAA